MFKHRLTVFTSILIFMSALSSCSVNGDDSSGSYEEIGVFSVTASGFTGDNGVADGLFGFEDGDCIGLFAVNDGAIEIDNLCLKAVKTDEGMAWTVSSGDTLFNLEASYYAYFPYAESLPEDVNAQATDALGFFADMIHVWEPASDQSDLHGGFRKSNLMTGSGTLSEGTLVLDMVPRMQLCVFELPGIRYRFTNTDYSLTDYSVPSRMVYSGFSPYENGTKSYYIVNPYLQNSVEGAYYSGGEETEWTFSVSDPGGCSVLEIGGGYSEIEHNLQIGDFFLADGSLMSKDTDESEVKSADVIGIVFMLDPSRIGEAEKEALGGDAHALVVSPMNSLDSYMRWYTNYDDLTFSRDESEVGLPAVLSEGNPSATFLNADSDISGYRNTHLIITERAEDVEKGYYTPFKSAVDFAQEAGGPVDGLNTTGWFFPSYGQMMDVFRAFSGCELGVDEYFYEWGDEWYWSIPGAGDFSEILNAAASKISDDRKNDLQLGEIFWTSTPVDDSRACNIGFSVDYVDCIYEYKSNGGFLRPVLAF